MIINAHLEVSIPNDVFCSRKNGERCSRVENDSRSQLPYCSLFNTFLQSGSDKLIKCPDCLDAMIEELCRH